MASYEIEHNIPPHSASALPAAATTAAAAATGRRRRRESRQHPNNANRRTAGANTDANANADINANANADINADTNTNAGADADVGGADSYGHGNGNADDGDGDTRHEDYDPPPRRPDLSSFFAALAAVDTSRTRNPHAVPTPGAVAAAFRLLADAFAVMRRQRLAVAADTTAAAAAAAGTDTAAETGRQGSGGATAAAEEYASLMDMLIESLLREADTPPKQVKGCSQEFLDGLERVPKTSLKPTDMCPICSNAFIEDKYPLVVRLPCHTQHVFDLECIAPWLQLHATCPLDRADLLARLAPPLPQQQQRGAAGSGKAYDEDAEEEEDDEDALNGLYA